MTPTPDTATADRLLYLRALDPEGALPLTPLDTPVPDEDPGTAGAGELADEARRWGAEQTARFRTELGAKAATEPVVRCLLLNSAPLALSAGSWLQWMSSAANGDTGLALEILALYAGDLGVGYPGADRGSAYRAALAHHRLPLDTDGVGLTSNDLIQNVSFRLPALLLAMSRQPDRYFAEILGADLFLRAVGTPPPLAVLPETALGPMTARDIDLGSTRTGQGPSALERSLTAAGLCLAPEEPEPGPPLGPGAPPPPDRPTAPDRLRHGFRRAAREYRRWCEALLREAVLAHHPDYDIWRLLFGRARQAAVYHGRYRLDGRPLAEWFADIEAGPAPFLDALAASPLVRPGNPDRSPLIRGLISETGPMFRVFTEDEVAAIRRWIAQLPADGTPTADRRALHDVQRTWFRRTAGPEPGETAPQRPPESAGPGSTRDAYRRLLTREDSPAIRRYAHDYARRWLIRSGFRLDAAPHQLPARWDPERGLSPWLLAEHDRHGAEFGVEFGAEIGDGAADGGDTPVPTREQLISSTLQLAPLIMIDGAWLQGFTDYRLASSPVGHLLFRTYWDELGNGERELNHPRIYRRLLGEMGHELPPTASAAFAEWPGFHDESFALPVFWLSVSRFPRTFQPEILGLNLAMELSGVGGSYRTARVGLEKYGFSTQFVDLHNTIDNVATGHSAWAAEAVDAFMAQVPGVLGPGGDPAIWRRIRIGYRSLNSPRTLGSALYARLRGRGAAERSLPAGRG
ncbi:iron-containing redox enzyme family protein [Streptomyces sp. NPDC004610]|uniref:iron-containing redox enzyme family protein n=1 Tax=unclassified Streptomyces TaxID=2593676 RepID=UPI0033ABBD3C